VAITAAAVVALAKEADLVMMATPIALVAHSPVGAIRATPRSHVQLVNAPPVPGRWKVGT